MRGRHKVRGGKRERERETDKRSVRENSRKWGKRDRIRERRGRQRAGEGKERSTF